MGLTGVVSSIFFFSTISLQYVRVSVVDTQTLDLLKSKDRGREKMGKILNILKIFGQRRKNRKKNGNSQLQLTGKTLSFFKCCLNKAQHDSHYSTVIQSNVENENFSTARGGKSIFHDDPHVWREVERRNEFPNAIVKSLNPHTLTHLSSLPFFSSIRSEHFNNIQKEENNKKRAIEESLTKEADKKVKHDQQPSPKVENLDPNKHTQQSRSHTSPKKIQIKHERPLKCLETLAQKAGITFDEKYDMEKSQSPSQVQQTMQAQQQPALQITQEQYQQLTQQLQLQQAFANSQQGTIHVKQEFQTQQQQQPQSITAAEFKQLQDQQQQLQQMQIVQAEASQNSHANSQVAAAQQALQQAVQSGQIPAEWQQQQQRVVLQQQPMQNAQYLQPHQIYSPQLVMSGNILHGGLGQQQQIQLIAAGKPFQNQLTQQMLTAGGKTVSSFGGYTMPTIPTSQSQTVLFSPVQLNGVIGSQAQQQQQSQQSILPNMQTQQTPTKAENKPIQGKNILQKVSQAQAQQQQTVTGSVANQQNNLQSVQVSQTMPTAQLLSGQTMQFASPWITQAGAMTTPFWNGLQQPIQLASPILIRGTNPDGTPTFIQQSPQQQTQQTVLSPLNREYREYTSKAANSFVWRYFLFWREKSRTLEKYQLPKNVNNENEN